MGKACDKDERFMVVVDEASSSSEASVFELERVDELKEVIGEAWSKPKAVILGECVNELNDGVWTNKVSHSLNELDEILPGSDGEEYFLAVVLLRSRRGGNGGGSEGGCAPVGIGIG